MCVELAVVKVGGSLYDLPDLAPRLQSWLKQAPGSDVLLVPGGGPTADVIRAFDRTHQLGEERAHWLALDAMRLNAQMLSVLLSADLVERWDEFQIAKLRREGMRNFVLDARAFASRDRQVHPEAALPHRWSVTSDSIAARIAVVSGADHLILLKSVTIPEGMDWEEAGERGFVDEWFARTMQPALPRLQVQTVNFREWRPRDIQA
jgi:aspartokinase-like uncharacterized kinase